MGDAGGSVSGEARQGRVVADVGWGDRTLRDAAGQGEQGKAGEGAAVRGGRRAGEEPRAGERPSAAQNEGREARGIGGERQGVCRGAG